MSIQIAKKRQKNQQLSTIKQKQLEKKNVSRRSKISIIKELLNIDKELLNFL